MKKYLLNVVESLMGRHMLYRIGRALYSQARGDCPNDSQFNGEVFLQHQIVEMAATSRQKLIVFDVGANVGDWTISMLNQASEIGFSDLEIHAFEPVPSTFALLAKRIAAHPLSGRVKLTQAAVSSEKGRSEMYIFSDLGGTNSLHEDPTHIKGSVAKVEVLKTTVQEYCNENNIDEISLLKCDTEGHDMEVLMGAKELFDKRKITVSQFEYNIRWIYSRHYLKDVFDCFMGDAFAIGKVTSSNIELYDNWHPELEKFFEGNYIIVAKEALKYFQTRKVAFDIHKAMDVTS